MCTTGGPPSGQAGQRGGRLHLTRRAHDEHRPRRRRQRPGLLEAQRVLPEGHEPRPGRPAAHVAPRQDRRKARARTRSAARRRPARARRGTPPGSPVPPWRTPGTPAGAATRGSRPRRSTPASWCRPSTFCVITAVTRPSCCSSAIARCAAFGRACANVDRSAPKKSASLSGCVMASAPARPTSRTARGRTAPTTLPGRGTWGSPDSAEIPAPVNATTPPAPRPRRASRSCPLTRTVGAESHR